MMTDLGVVGGMLRNPLLIKSMQYIEIFTYKHCNAIFAVTDSMANEIHKRTINKNVYTLSDWFDDRHYIKNKYLYITICIFS